MLNHKSNILLKNLEQVFNATTLPKIEGNSTRTCLSPLLSKMQFLRIYTISHAECNKLWHPGLQIVIILCKLILKWAKSVKIFEIV